MKLIYEKADLIKILKKVHGYSGANRFKIDHSTQDVLDVEIKEGQVLVTLRRLGQRQK